MSSKLIFVPPYSGRSTFSPTPTHGGMNSPFCNNKQFPAVTFHNSKINLSLHKSDVPLRNCSLTAQIYLYHRLYVHVYHYTRAFFRHKIVRKSFLIWCLCLTAKVPSSHETAESKSGLDVTNRMHPCLLMYRAATRYRGTTSVIFHYPVLPRYPK